MSADALPTGGSIANILLLVAFLPPGALTSKKAAALIRFRTTSLACFSWPPLALNGKSASIHNANGTPFQVTPFYHFVYPTHSLLLSVRLAICLWSCSFPFCLHTTAVSLRVFSSQEYYDLLTIPRCIVIVLLNHPYSLPCLATTVATLSATI